MKRSCLHFKTRSIRCIVHLQRTVLRECACKLYTAIEDVANLLFIIIYSQTNKCIQAPVIPQTNNNKSVCCVCTLSLHTLYDSLSFARLIYVFLFFINSVSVSDEPYVQCTLCTPKKRVKTNGRKRKIKNNDNVVSLMAINGMVLFCFGLMFWSVRFSQLFIHFDVKNYCYFLVSKKIRCLLSGQKKKRIFVSL